MIKKIMEGDKAKQGDAHCPQCGETVLIGTHWGDPPKCPNCGVYYIPIPAKPMFH